MNKRKKPKAALIILLVVFVYFIYTVINQEGMLTKKEAEREAALQKIEAAEKEKKSLQNQKENLNSDEYIEKAARDKLGMVKNGEKVFVDVNK